VLLAVCLCVLAASSARADVRILSSPGGEVSSFLALFEVLRESGQRVVIDGPCYSACTLVLITIPRRRICMTHRAVLGFHAAKWLDRYGRMGVAPEASAIVLNSYPPAIRNWIRRRGGLTSRMLLLRGRDLARMYPRCR
jgi:hypothetical protein